MDTLVENYLGTPNLFDFNCYALPVIEKQNEVHEYGHEIEEFLEGESSPVLDLSPSGSEGNIREQGDPNDPMLKYISQMLLEEDELLNKPCMFHDFSALLAAEKSFYDVLNEPDRSTPCVPDQENAKGPIDPEKILSFKSDQRNVGSPSGNSTLTWPSRHNTGSSDTNCCVDTDWISDRSGDVSAIVQSSGDSSARQFTPCLNLQSSISTHSFLDAAHEMDESLMSLLQGPASSFNNEINLDSSFLPDIEKITHLDMNSTGKPSTVTVMVEGNRWETVPNDSSKKKYHFREDNNAEEGRCSKQFASSDEESLPLEMYDQVLLCPKVDPLIGHEPSPDDALRAEAINKLQQMEQSFGSSRGRPRGGKRSGVRKEVVDLRSLLVQCAQAVARYDSRTTHELLKRIRQHSSAHGDGVERLAHYFANSLEARLDGTGTAMYASFRTRRISAAHILKGYQMYVTACPFKKVSNIFANRWIHKLASGSTRLHIIDLGILYGFQWPCLIKCLSERPGGPPMLRITGVDLPQPGLRPAGRVEETGQRLAKYCERFNVPFEYNAIAKNWTTLQAEDFKLQKDELLIVNCLDRLAFVPDETVLVDSPRDAILNLINRIHPNLFIHGAVNGTFNSPFFVTRFREALFHFSSLFDMFEATIPREAEERALFEEEIFGRDSLNVIACEGKERVDRPETYKQWQVRNLRAGFKQLPLDREIMSRVKTKVRSHYHRDFLVDEDNNWMLQGWKGRVIHALSCWVPA